MKSGLPVVLLLFLSVAVRAAGLQPITLATARSALVLAKNEQGRMLELHYGAADFQPPNGMAGRERELYPQYGDGFGENYISEPALQVAHADGNTSTDLIYVRHETQAIDTNVTLTRVELKDPAYPFFVTLCFKTYFREDIIEQWAEIRNGESGAVGLQRYDSCAPLFQAGEYWLTQFHGEYRHEATLAEEKLGPGLKVLASQLGVRASRYCLPSFMLSYNQPADEENGEAIGASLEWSGSFELAFELDPKNRLRALCGINPLGEEYHLKPGAVFKTPAVLWTWSGHGKGQVSRNFHAWARHYGVRDGDKPRPVVLNNWEATGFDFDEKTIVSLFDGAKDLGVDTFLLDDGWFGNAHPRNDDHAGLGDWQVNTNKLPQGLSYLAGEANRRGVNFGIWIEPEMLNPRSDLFAAHPEWAMQQPQRPPDLSRNQLDLDLSRPAVREFAWNVVSNTLARSGAGYLKWDANRFVTQPGSTFLSSGEQSDLLVDYNFALYDVMARMVANFPGVTAMACAGGGGRADYGALKFFHLFWPSDNTDPRDRVKIQWGFSHFFPADTIAAHVTKMGGRPLKFSLDVAMSGALGLDLDARKLTQEEKQTIASTIALYKNEIRDVVEQGDLYRLESPYDHPRAALEYVSPDRTHAVVFVYQLTNTPSVTLKMRGLDPQRKYLIREVNLTASQRSALAADGQTIDGPTLLRDGFRPPCKSAFDSAVIEFKAED